MRVRAIGINRAQTLQRMGKYNATKEEEKYLGLEASGEIYHPNNLHHKLFDGIALLSGGAYSQYALVPKTHIMPLPKSISVVHGAAIPEAWLTAFQLIQLSGAKEGQNIVIYAAASGVGTAAIQICKLLKINAFCVVSTPEKGKVCLELGSRGVVYYKSNPEWEKQLIKVNNGNRFHAVLDCVGSQNYQKTVELLDVDGKWILFGLLSGPKIQMNLAVLLGRRINLITTTLKTRSFQYKNELIESFSQVVLPAFETAVVRPIIHEVLQTDWSSAEAFIRSHQIMESNLNIGKILIQYN